MVLSPENLKIRLDGRLRAVWFDLDGTLRINRPTFVQSFYDFAVRLGAEDGQERRLRSMRWTHYYWAQSPELVQDQQDYPDEADFWQHYSLRSLLAFDCVLERAQEWAPEVNRFMREERQSEDSLLPGVLETLQRLGEAGLRLAVLSNRSQPFEEYLESIGLSSYFELAVAAGKLAAWKPDPAIFYHTLGAMQLSADQVVYVGDNYYADVVGAQRAGIQPVLLDPDGVFPEADCPVLCSFIDLTDWLLA